MRRGLALIGLLAAAAPAQSRLDLGAAETVPLLELTPEGKARVTLAGFQDGRLVVYLYGESCGPCEEQLGYLQRLAKASAEPRVLAVAVTFGARKDRQIARDLPGVVSLQDEGGALWDAIRKLDLIDSPPGAGEDAQAVLPLTLYVGWWAVRDHGTTRMSMETFVTRRKRLLTAVLGDEPKQKQIDIEDEKALSSNFRSLPASSDGGRAETPDAGTASAGEER